MKDHEAMLARVQAEEKELVFADFCSEDALAIGQALIAHAKAERVAIAINITLNRRQVFHYSFDGTSPNNDNWIMGKENVVYHFFMSSLRMALNLEAEGKTITEQFGFSTEMYKAAGGSFPITLKGTGVVGTITVSGLAGEEDHAYAVEAIRAHLAR